jgi:broad specificity phosphatase PhoE
MTLLDFANEKYAFDSFTVPNEAGGRSWAFHHKDTMIKMCSEEVISLGDKWYTHPYFAETKFGEGIERTNAAVDEFLLSLGYKHNRETRTYEVVNGNEKRIALFAHQGFGISFLSSVLDIPYPIAARMDMSHSSMTVINFSNGWGEVCIPKLLQLSNDSHLYREGIITGYCNNPSLKF